MATTKNKLPVINTPIGVAAYAWLDKPDTEFAKSEDDVKFKMSLILDPADAGVEEFVKKLRAVGEAHAEKIGVELEEDYKIAKITPTTKGTKKKPIKEEFAGKWVFEMKSKFKPTRFDARKRVLPDGIVKSGDLVRAEVAVSPYEAFGTGISLKLNVVQLIEKRNSGGSGGDTLDEYEGGYEFDADGVGNDGDENQQDGGGADF